MLSVKLLLTYPWWDPFLSASAAWDPFTKRDKSSLEMVQRRAARFVKRDYRRTTNVSTLIEQLGWTSLAERRKIARLVIFSRPTTAWQQYHWTILKDRHARLGSTRMAGASLLSRAVLTLTRILSFRGQSTIGTPCHQNCDPSYLWTLSEALWTKPPLSVRWKIMHSNLIKFAVAILAKLATFYLSRFYFYFYSSRFYSGYFYFYSSRFACYLSTFQRQK